MNKYTTSYTPKKTNYKHIPQQDQIEIPNIGYSYQQLTSYSQTTVGAPNNPIKTCNETFSIIAYLPANGRRCAGVLHGAFLPLQLQNTKQRCQQKKDKDINIFSCAIIDRDWRRLDRDLPTKVYNTVTHTIAGRPTCGKATYSSSSSLCSTPAHSSAPFRVRSRDQQREQTVGHVFTRHS